MSIADARSPIAQQPSVPAWHVLGAGSIGCLFASALQRAGISTRLILRDAASLALWREAGGAIVLQRGAGQWRIELPAATAATLEPNTPLRQILVCTKAQQTRAALEALGAAVDPTALIVLLQNGMGVREQLQALLPRATILHALSTEGAYRTERFHVVHAGQGETVIGGAGLQAVAAATAAALHCELRIGAVDDIERRLWLKLAVNSVINPLTALHDCSNGAVLELPDIDILLPALCSEACAVANAEGQALHPAEMVDAVREVCRATSANRSSMLQDIAARRATEIDFINGHIVRTAQRHGIPCPQQSALLDRLKALEQALGCR
jgi:2-dehydropantoate 2-reductase